jgi:hypothetical protein
MPSRRGASRKGRCTVTVCAFLESELLTPVLYRGAEWVNVPHPSLGAGDACPACGQGTIYEKAPGVLVRITGQPPLAATIYQLQKLRCHLCGQVFTAPAPVEAGGEKYDATATSGFPGFTAKL